MELTRRSKEQPFLAAVVSCSADPTLEQASYAESTCPYFITDIKIVQSTHRSWESACQQFQLTQAFSLIVSRNPAHLPIIDVASFQSIPEGWQSIVADQHNSHQFKSFLCFKRGSLAQNGKCVFQIEILDDLEQQKPDEVTQPSLTYKNEIINSYIKIENKDFKKYMNFLKKDHVQIEQIRFKPLTTCLYERQLGEIDIPNLAILCFPEGVKLSKKESGFKFFTFILTNDSAERYYCNSIIFSEKCSHEAALTISQKYGVANEKGICIQKVFTLISQYTCTDHTSKILQFMYRVYLSEPREVFEEKVNRLAQLFTYQTQSFYCKLEMDNFRAQFKINTSYPQTSTQSIYTVFKFLDVENIITVVEGLLLERKIFFISNCQNIIGMAIEAFISFIYPLNWIHGIINPLSSSMIEYKDAPMTVIFGVSSQQAHKLSTSTDCILVYMDSNQVQIRNKEDTTHKFSFHLRKQLIERLRQFSVYDRIDVRDYLNNPENLSLYKTQKAQDPHFDVYKIRNIFFQLTVYILRNYKDYFIKPKKDSNSKSDRNKGFQKYYDINSLLNLNRKDPFMQAFFKTSLFSVLIQKKQQEPNNKWIKMLDRAIRKIESYTKHYIQQESDNLSDTNEAEQAEVYVPKGCLNMITMMSRGSDEDQHSRSTPSPSPKRPKLSLQKQFEDEKVESPTKNQGRMSLPNQYQRRQSQILEGNRELRKRISNQTQRYSADGREDEKQEKETDRGSESCDKSQTETPSLKQSTVIVYEFETENDKEKVGVANLICNIFSLPYRKMSNSVVTRWTKKKLQSLKSWKNKNEKKETVEVDMAMEPMPDLPRVQTQAKSQKKE